MFVDRGDGAAGVRDALNVVAVAGDETLRALGPQCRDNACGASAPVVTGEHRVAKLERVHQAQQILPQNRLLSGPQRSGIGERRGAVTAEVRNDDAAPDSGQRFGHLVVGVDVVGKAVQQDRRWRPFHAVVEIGNVELTGFDSA